jgi:hypothetical protein
VTQPKLFISYSWSSPEHETWVIALAEELVNQGIVVILDKWDLQPGHDAIAFMEQMVTDATVTKVLLICDRKYAEKSNARSGGAGTEAQIITPELYAKRAQDKFVAVVRERDDEGHPWVPTYYKGRIFIDLSNDATYATELERLLRWVWDKPLHVKPQLGKRPEFLDEDPGSTKMNTSVSFRRAIDAIRNGRDNAVPATVEYLDHVVAGLENFRIAATPATIQTFDAIVIKSIEEFLPYRNQLIELFLAVASYRADNEMVESLHRFFERLIPYLHPPENQGSFYETDFDNFRFIIHELFLCCLAAFIKLERFAQAGFFIESDYYYEDPRLKEPMQQFICFSGRARSLEGRNRRLQKNRLSLEADMLKERASVCGIDFKHIMVTDFILYIRSLAYKSWQLWWPDTLVFVAFRSYLPFEPFARAKSRRYFEKLKPALNVENKEELERIISEAEADADSRIPRWQFDRLNPRLLLGLDAIGTSP